MTESKCCGPYQTQFLSLFQNYMYFEMSWNERHKEEPKIMLPSMSWDGEGTVTCITPSVCPVLSGVEKRFTLQWIYFKLYTCKLICHPLTLSTYAFKSGWFDPNISKSIFDICLQRNSVYLSLIFFPSTLCWWID